MTWLVEAQRFWEAHNTSVREQADTLGLTPRKHKNALHQRLIRLSEAHHCNEAASGWLQMKKTRDKGTKISISAAADGKTNRNHPAIQLKALDKLEDGALLAFEIVISRKKALVAYTMGISGRLRDERQDWYARVDLTLEPEGEGPCGHPLQHAHVGPDPDRQFQVRLPLPFLTPAQTMDWLLATAHPPLEPRPPPK